MKSILARWGFIALVAPAFLCFAPGYASPQQSGPSNQASPAQNGQQTDDETALAVFTRMAKKQVADIREAMALPTPRTADGHPDLSGYWVAPVDLLELFTSHAKTELNPDGSSKGSLFGNEADEHKFNVALLDARRKDSSLRPLYKPEFQAKAADNFEKALQLDPAFRCAPQGVPRMGVPAEIVQTSGAVYLLYANLDLRPSVPNPYRIIPTDGRAHNPNADAMADGDAVGHWEDDTLVVDVVNIDPDTWLDRDGSFHDENLHVVERLTRRGNALRYEVIEDDPTMFQRQFSPKPVIVLLGKPGDHAPLDYPCVEMDQSHLATNERN